MIKDKKIKNVSDFLNDEVKEYSIHVIKERALPSVIDGFKPGPRKVVDTAEKTAKKKIKTISLVGKAISDGGYNKGDGALPGIIANLTQSFPGSNNVPYLLGHGEFGSRQLPSGMAAPRYTDIQIHPNFMRFFIDKELYEYDDDYEKYEPKSFLPIVPTILLNPIKGIAVGYACEFQPYNLKDIKKNIVKLLNGKKMSEMTPFYNGYTGKIHSVDEKWTMDGILDKSIKSMWTITEIPVGISREQYISHLEKLVEKNTIKDYNEKISDGFEFEIILSREQFRVLNSYDEEKLLKMFKLRISLNENMNCISEDNNLLQFTSTLDIIEYFVNYRLTVMTRRKDYKLDLISNQINAMTFKEMFINAVLDGKISLKALKSKSDLKDRITLVIKNVNPYLDDLIKIPIYTITEDTIKDIKKKKVDLNTDYLYYKNISEGDLFKEDLKQI